MDAILLFVQKNNLIISTETSKQCQMDIFGNNKLILEAIFASIGSSLRQISTKFLQYKSGSTII